jgi:cytoskeleton protein RodZ
MVVAASASVLDGFGSMKLAISPEGLRSLLNQVENELHRSEAYQTALANLQQEGTDAFSGSQALKTVGREAIRLALRHLAKYHSNHSTTHSGSVTPTVTSTFSSNAVKSDDKVSTGSASEASKRASQRLVSSSSVNSSSVTSSSASSNSKVTAIAQPAKPHLARIEPRVVVSQIKKITPEASLSPTAQKRIAELRQIGTELGSARQTKGVSLDWLHTHTWIPIHLIKALEAGDVDRLPEDIYIRGFIRRIADALELDGTSMASSLLMTEQARTVIPSWQQRSPEQPTLRPVHLYLSYAALMAGALGGLAWMSNQTESSQLVNPALPDMQPIPEATQSPTPMLGAPSSTTTLPTSPEGSIANPEVVPPETLRTNGNW